MSDALLNLSNLSVTLRRREVLRSVDLRIGRGEVVGLIGRNGAGKTTLMRAALGLVPHGGTSSLTELPPAARARAAAWLPQAREIAWPLPVEEVVMLGRMPHRAAGRAPTLQDREQVEGALARMELHALRQRAATRLSGGEQARVLIARALAQDAPLLMADEPIAGLDPAHQIATMRRFGELAQTGKSCLVSLHDLGLAVRHCTRLVLLEGGRIAADGSPAEVLSPERLAEVFGITAVFRQTEHGPVFHPLEVIA